MGQRGRGKERKDGKGREKEERRREKRVMDYGEAGRN